MPFWRLEQNDMAMALRLRGLGKHLVVRRSEGIDKRAMDSQLFVTTVRRMITGAVNV